MTKVQIKCRMCAKQPKFGLIGKTFYVLGNDNILCHRHWYQCNTPECELFGDYDDLNAKLNPKAKKSQIKPIDVVKAIVKKSNQAV
jgi:hypothetical protein